jgi:hypothetical protein
MRRALVLTVIACAALAPPAAGQEEPVLGAADLYDEFGSGWGTAHPEFLDNGGVPSGRMSGIAWTGWGDATAFGRGKSPQYRPGGGYYRRQVDIQLRATRLGECVEGVPAYTRLVFRKRRKPGGAWEDWFPWTLDLCDLDARPARCGNIAFEPNSDYGVAKITAWDTRCRVARRLARASRSVRIKPRFARYRFRRGGWVCNGYSLGEGLPRISFSCSRQTAVVEFVRS